MIFLISVFCIEEVVYIEMYRYKCVDLESGGGAGDGLDFYWKFKFIKYLYMKLLERR